MIIYENTKGGFVDEVRHGSIAARVKEQFDRLGLGHNNFSEYQSWNNSLMYMRNVLDDAEIEENVQVAIEYQIPLTSKRVDFLLAGEDGLGSNNVVVVELKQWENSGKTSRPDIVTAHTGGAERAVVHPCYQAYAYARMIENFNEEIERNQVKLRPCAFLHNYREENRGNIDNVLYKDAIESAPLFLAEDVDKLRNFIKTYVKKRDNIDLLMKIENGKIKPAKALQDTLTSMMQGNQEFYLIDEQKVVYETVIKKAKNCLANNTKCTVIIEGGPGTGKSVVAIQLLVNLTNQGYNTQYVTKNAQPRKVYSHMLRKEQLLQLMLQI